MSIKLTLEFPNAAAALRVLQTLTNTFVCETSPAPSSSSATPPAEATSTAEAVAPDSSTGAKKTPAKKSPAPETPAASPAASSDSTSAPTASAPTEAAPKPDTTPQPAAGYAELTDKEVRAALVRLQSIKGKEPPKKILGAYSLTGTIGGLPKDKYAQVIAECKAAEAA